MGKRLADLLSLIAVRHDCHPFLQPAFGTADTVTMTGPAGSWFLGDTYGAHKGALPRRGRCLLLSAQYNVNRTPHGPLRPILPRGTGGHDPFVNQIYVEP